MKYNKIKNIIFDLGGVIMNLDTPKTIRAFEKIGITDIVNGTGHHYEHLFFYDFEVGKISKQTFLEKLKLLLSRKASNNEIIKAWNVMILGMPKQRIDFILKLKNKYRVFLLSNTNSLHQEKFLSEFKKKYSFPFSALFEKAYYSHEIGLRKPNLEAFQFVLKDSNLNAHESLFIDDSLQNINAAKKVGIETFHIQDYNLLSSKNSLLK